MAIEEDEEDGEQSSTSFSSSSGGGATGRNEARFGHAATVGSTGRRAFFADESSDDGPPAAPRSAPARRHASAEGVHHVPKRRQTVAKGVAKNIMELERKTIVGGKTLVKKTHHGQQVQNDVEASLRSRNSRRTSLITFQQVFSDHQDRRSSKHSTLTGSGFMVDYLLRLRGRSSGPLVNHCDILLGPRMLVASMIDSFDFEAGMVFNIADFVAMERLIQNLHDDLVIFWKSQGSPDWTEASKHLCLEVSRRLVRMTRMAVCLRDEVDNSMKRRIMMRRRRCEAYANRREGQVERYCRLQDFWTQAHMDNHRKVMPAQALQALETRTTTICRSSISSDDDIDGIPKLLSSLPGLLRPASQSETRPGSQPSRPGLRLNRDSEHRRRLGSRGSIAKSQPAKKAPTQAQLNGEAWKTRGARSNCSFGGWDWAKGSPKAERSQRPSTRGKEDIRRDVIAGHEPPYWRDEDLEEKPASPGKWWSKGRELSGFLKPKHVKSASSPNLRMGSLHTVRHNLWTGSDDSSTSQVSQLSLISGSPQAAHASTFTEPWKTSDPNLKWLNSPSQKYLRACQKNRKSPKPLPFVTGHSAKLGAGEKGLLDGDLSAITKMTSDVIVEEVELQGNVLLTESSLVPFTESLYGKDVQTLNLNRCVQARDAMLQCLVDLMSHPEGVQRLTTLDLSSINISPKCHLTLCKAIEAHPSLESVYLAETGIGGNCQVKECLSALFGCKTLTSLGLAWNCFSADAFDHLGQCCVGAQVLRSLDLANCAAATEEGDITPIVIFLEHLCRDKKLTYLDLSLNRIDYRGALILEDALLDHRRLRELNMAENPMGLLGMRSLLRLLAHDESGLVFFKCEGCSIGMQPTRTRNIFNAANPGGRYHLDLAHPYSRALLRMLYRTCQRLSIAPDLALTDLYYSLHGYSAQHDPVANSWIVPDRGRLHVTFSLERATEGVLKDVDERNFCKFLDAHNQIMRRAPGFKKVVPICAQWKSLEGRMKEQLTFINALSKDFMLTYSQIRELTRCREMCMQLMLQLMPVIVGGSSPLYLAMQQIPTLGELVRFMIRSKAYLDFNPQNPTGHFKLDLANPSDYVVAERILLIDRWEAGIALRHSYPDTSQKGNRSQVRNVTYQGNTLHESITRWTLPDYDLLEFDYSSSKRPQLKDPTLDEITFSNILVVLQQSEVMGLDSEPGGAGHEQGVQRQLEALRRVSHLMYVRAKQLRSMLGIFSEAATRIQVCVLFFNRVKDFYNEKVFRVRLEDPTEYYALCDKIGYVSFFPFIQPEQGVFRWDFAHHDQRLATNLFCSIMTKERRENAREVCFTKEDGTLDPLPLGIPRSWEYFERMPKAGVFYAKYQCSPEDRRYNVRREMFSKYGNWDCDLSEDQIEWWCDIGDTPQDVLEFLTFLSRHFKTTKKAFEFIDGVDGNKVINLKEFMEGLHQMKFSKFRGRHEEERMKALFRYLDPSGEGQVSEGEWEVLNFLWNEVQLSIREFVSFLERTLGDDMNEIWYFFDEDGSGEIDAGEWRVATRNVGYFGPVMPIFHFLDKDGEGSVSVDEFIVLEDFQDDSEDSDSSNE